MKKTILVLTLLVSACANKEHAINSDSNYLLLPAAQATSDQRDAERQRQLTEEYIGRKPKTALAGHVYLEGRIPRPLSRVMIELSKNDDGKWKSITTLSTEMDGSFQITQQIYAGAYRLASLDKRYHGEIFFDLNKPHEDIVLTLKETKK